jgi:hypothetical protein
LALAATALLLGRPLVRLEFLSRPSKDLAQLDWQLICPFWLLDWGESLVVLLVWVRPSLSLIVTASELERLMLLC